MSVCALTGVMGDNADPQQVLVLTKEECRKKGEQLSMPKLSGAR